MIVSTSIQNLGIVQIRRTLRSLFDALFPSFSEFAAMSFFYSNYLSGGQQPNKGDEAGDAADIVPEIKTSSEDPESKRSSVSQLRGHRIQIHNEPADLSPRSLPRFEKTEMCQRFLHRSLAQHYLFETLTPEEISKIVDCMKSTTVSAGDVIITEGDTGDLFYCLEAGSAIASVEGVGEVCRYEPGGCFGELALLYNCQRAATIISITSSVLWTLDLRTFKYVLAATSSADMARRCGFLKKCSFLEPLTNEQISKVAGALEVSTYEAGSYVLQQGERGTSFFIIEEGAVQCTQIKASGREVELIPLKEGDYFGEMALMLNETRHANVIATTKVKCLHMERAAFDLLLGSVRQILAKRMRVRILQSVPLLGRMPEAKLSKLAGYMRVQAFTDGTYIITEGEEGSRFYIINEGEVVCTKKVPGTDDTAQEEEITRLYPQEFFGERALVTNETRKANVIAVGQVECLVLDRSSFQLLLTEVHDDIAEVIESRERVTGRIMTEATKKAFVKLSSSPVHFAVVTQSDYVLEDLVSIRTIGTGTFGRVKLVQHASSGSIFALKCINKTEVVNLHQQRNIIAEKDLLFECADCPFILRLFQTFNLANQIFMLTEYIQGGEMWSYIYERHGAVPLSVLGGFHSSAVKFYAANVVLAFQHMHSLGIAYRDLKPENLLLDSLGYLKIVDFGFAKRLPYKRSGGALHDKTYTLCGTPEYLSPEIILSKGYDKACDYWALGCLIYEMFFTATPFQADTTSKIFQNIIASEKSLKIPSSLNPNYAGIIRSLLKANPSYRLGSLSGGVQDILNDPFFSSVKMDEIKARTAAPPFVPQVTGVSDSSNFNQYEEDDHVPEYTGSQDIFEPF